MAVWVFSASVVFVLYVLFGYPALAWVLARLRARPIQRSGWAPTVTVLLAVKNGEKWIRRKLESLLALDYPADKLRILVLSDGSSDATDALAAEYADRGVELVALPPGGKAKALNAGIQQATSEVLFFTDVRQDIEPGALKKLTACLADPNVGVVSGELVIRDSEGREQADIGLYWRYEKWIRKQLSARDSILGATGCIYAMKREYAAAMPANTLLDDVHLPLAAFFRGRRVVFEPAAKAFDYPAALSSEFRRKVRTLAGVYQVMREYPALVGPGNRMWIDFMSHKFARLILPFALIAIAASSAFLPQPWNVWLPAAQAAFYLTAAVDAFIPNGFILKRLTSPIRVFAVMMLASLSAASILFRPVESFWKETRVSANPIS